MTLVYLATLLLVENILLMAVSLTNGQYYVRVFLITNMMLIAAFSPKLFAVGHLVSNYGNVFYASVFCSQCITLRRFGLSCAVANMWSVLFALGAYYVLSGLLSLAPSAPEQESLSFAVDLLTSHQFWVIAASALAFLAAQGLLLDIGHRYTTWWGLPLGIVLGQFVDSAIFFPIAFSHLHLSQLEVVVVSGFSVKVVFAIFLMPAYFFALRRGTSPPVASSQMS